jgi:NAD(P)-dependent dehydrogenase (short-subunit alcohol dehydrogenase family)
MGQLDGKVAVITGDARGQGRSHAVTLAREGATFEETVPAMKSLNLLPIPLIEAEDVSNAVLFLVADTGRYMTGSSLVVDAGTTICPPGTWRG